MASNVCSCSSREMHASSGSDASRVVVTTEGPAPVSANVVLIVRAESTRYLPSPFFRHNTRSRTYRQCRGYSVNGVSIYHTGWVYFTDCFGTTGAHTLFFITCRNRGHHDHRRRNRKGRDCGGRRRRHEGLFTERCPIVASFTRWA
eukprot:scaffold4750_cov140-Isochrysis_galbana.AAC.10